MLRWLREQPPAVEANAASAVGELVSLADEDSNAIYLRDKTL